MKCNGCGNDAFIMLGLFGQYSFIRCRACGADSRVRSTELDEYDEGEE